MKHLSHDSAKGGADFEDWNEHPRRHGNGRRNDREDEREDEIAAQVDEDVCVFGAPVLDDRCLLYAEVFLRPREIGEQLADLVVRAQLAGYESAHSVWIRDR